MLRHVFSKSAFFAVVAIAIPMQVGANAEEKAATAPIKKRIVGIVIFDDVEALDFCGPYEVFSFAHVHVSAPKDAPPGSPERMENLFDVRVVAASTAPVTCRGGLKVIPTNSFDDSPQVDIVVVPGGRGKDAALKDKGLLAWVSGQAAKAELVTSVCTGSFILAEAGLLNEKEAATHQMSVTKMQAQYPRVKVLPGRRVVEEGKVVSSAGVSSGLDMSLRVVSRLHGKEVAQRISRIIEYPNPVESY